MDEITEKSESTKRQQTIGVWLRAFESSDVVFFSNFLFIVILGILKVWMHMIYAPKFI